MANEPSGYVDARWVAEITGGSSSALAQLVELLGAQVDELRRLLERSGKEGISAQLTEQIHLMKGSTASLGMRAIADELAELERLARSGTHSPAPDAECYLGVLSKLGQAMNELKSLL